MDPVSYNETYSETLNETYYESLKFSVDNFKVRWYFQNKSHKDVKLEYRSQHWYEENYKLTSVDDHIAQSIYGYPFYDNYVLDIEQKYKDKLIHFFKKNPNAKFIYSRGHRGILVLYKGKLNHSIYDLWKWFNKRKIALEVYDTNLKYII